MSADNFEKPQVYAISSTGIVEEETRYNKCKTDGYEYLGNADEAAHNREYTMKHISMELYLKPLDQLCHDEMDEVVRLTNLIIG